MKNAERLRSYFDRIVDAWTENDSHELDFIRIKAITDYYNGILTYYQSTVILETVSKCMLLIKRERYAD